MLISNNNHHYKFRSYDFKGHNDPKNVERRMRQNNNDDILLAKSIIKAHDKAQNSPKTKLLHALPTIGAAIITTSIGLTQPGKLSSKIATGLGFLAIFEASKKLDEVFVNSNKAKKQDNKKEDSFIKTTLLSLGILLTSATGVAALAKKAGDSTKIGGFIKKEGQKLAKEIDSTRFGKFIENSFEPIRQKHKKTFTLAKFATIASTIIGQSLAQFKLVKDISLDIQKDSVKNFKQAKKAQQKDEI